MMTEEEKLHGFKEAMINHKRDTANLSPNSDMGKARRKEVNEVIKAMNELAELPVDELTKIIAEQERRNK